MIDFGQLPCIIYIIAFLLTLVSLKTDDSKKFKLMFMSYWIVSILMLLVYHALNAGGGGC